MTTTLIVFAVYLVIHVLSYLGKEAAKRKEKERQREAAQRRQLEAGRMAPPSQTESRNPATVDAPFGTPSGQPPALDVPPSSRRTGKPVDDVAARRREQLEQLRQRREGKRPGTATAGHQSTAASSAGSLPSDVMRKRQPDSDQRRRAEAEVQRARQARLAEQKRQVQAAKARSAQAAAELRTHDESVPTRAAAVQVIAAQGTFNPIRDQLLAQLQDRKAIRQLLVVRELLDQPAALRPPPGDQP